jgi:hypothetical protein
MKGHRVVPCKWEPDVSSGGCVSKQQQKHAKDSVAQDRKDLLDKLGFVWKADELESKWNKQCEKLVAFERTKGHCCASFKHEKDRSPGVWVFTQQRKQSIRKTRLDRKRKFWTTSTSPGLMGSGMSNMQSLLSLNKSTAIVQCQPSMSKTCL